MAGMAFGKGKKGPVAPTPAKGSAKGGFPFAPKAPKPGKLKPPAPTFKKGGLAKGK